jgi:hypothetical protein
MNARIVWLALLLTMGYTISAAAQEQMKLFKIVSPKDEVIIGVTSDELRGFGSATDLDNLAQHLASTGQMTVWQYAVRKDQSGNLQQAPLKRIAVFKSDLLRIEPYTTPLPIVAPSK